MHAFPGSSMVEWAAVNRLVAGSSPARGASLLVLNLTNAEENRAHAMNPNSLDSMGVI